MHYDKLDIVFQEVPNEVSLAFRITGCPLQCKGCHSKSSQQTTGKKLNIQQFEQLIDKYMKGITCILFMGGEWYNDQLMEYLNIAKLKGLKTCLYTGLSNVSDELKRSLDYLKTGPWISHRGGLDSPTTNQQFWCLNTNQQLNKYFIKGEIN